MISRITKGNGFRGLCNYLEDQEKAHLIGGNMAGENSKELAAEFGEVRRLRPELTKPVFHCSLSLAPGEHLDDQVLHQVAEKFMTRMGMDPEKHQFAVYGHPALPGREDRKRKMNHIHIVGNRISFEGKLASDKHERLQARTICKELEIEHGLVQTRPLGKRREQDVERDLKPLTVQELGEKERLGLDKHPKEQAQERVGFALRASDGSAADFARKARENGLEVRYGVSRTGKTYGVSFHVLDAPAGAAKKFTGKELGAGFKWSGLEQKLTARTLEVAAEKALADKTLEEAKAIQALKRAKSQGHDWGM